MGYGCTEPAAKLCFARASACSALYRSAVRRRVGYKVMPSPLSLACQPYSLEASQLHLSAASTARRAKRCITTAHVALQLPAPRSQRHRVHPARRWPPIHWSLDARSTHRARTARRQTPPINASTRFTHIPSTHSQPLHSVQPRHASSSCVCASTSFHPTRLLFPALLFNLRIVSPCPSTGNSASIACVFRSHACLIPHS